MDSNNNVPAAHSINQRKNQWGVICVVLLHIQKMGQKIYIKKREKNALKKSRACLLHILCLV